MQKRVKKPPFLAEWFFKLIVENEEREFICGDLKEFYLEIYRAKGWFRAGIWYYVQLFKSVPQFVTNSIYWSLVMFKNYFKVSFRNITKNKAYFGINTIGLSIGMACCFLILFWIQDEISYDKFHENRDNIYRDYTVFEFENGRENIFEGSYYPLAEVLKEECAGVEEASRMQPIDNIHVKYGDKSFIENEIFAVDQDFLDIFTFTFLSGEKSSALENSESVVLTESAANKYFGNENPVGKMLIANSSLNLKITGVIKDFPKNSSLKFTMLIPFKLIHGDVEGDRTHWGGNPLVTFITLSENTDPSLTEENITNIVDKYDPKHESETRTLYLHPLNKYHLYNIGGGGIIVYIYVFAVVAFFVLIISCVNFINLSLVRSSRRAKEIGMRKVIGATKKDIMYQFFGESLVVAAISVFTAIMLAWILLPTFNTLAGKNLSLSTSGNLNLILGVIGVALFTSVLCSGYPSLFLSSFQPAKILKGNLKSGASRSPMRKALIIFQFCVAALLIICTITISSQMNFILSRNMGYSKENLVTIRMTGSLQENYETFKGELLKHSNISSVTTSLHYPLWIVSTTKADWEGKESDAKVLMNWDFVNFDYIETMGMEVIDGRSFSKDIATDAENACIVNEEAVKIMGIGSPVGKEMKTWFGELNVVGVVKNFHFESLHSDIKPVILKIRPSWSSYAYVRINSDDVASALSYIEDVHKQVNPVFPFEFSFLDKRIETLYSSEAQMKSMLSFFSGLSIFIACLGLLGLTAFLSELRTKEIGIRKTLGANSTTIVYLLSKDFLLWVLAANVIAWPIGYFLMSRYLENFAYRIDPGWMPYGLSLLFSVMIAIITIGYQSIKASRVNPVESLKYE